MKPLNALAMTATRALALAIAIIALAAVDTMATRAGLASFVLLGAGPALADDDDDDDDDDDGQRDDDDDDDNRFRAYRDREVLLIDPSAASLTRARALGFRVIETFDARAMGLRVTRLSIPRGWTMQRARRALNDIAPDAADLHHLYRPLQGADCARRPCLPRQQINWPKDTRSCGASAKIGIIDTAVETNHTALRGAKITARHFTRAPGKPDGHGTAVAALLVGAPNSEHAGLMPNAELLAADPFARDARVGLVADAVAVVRALDWLAQSGVRVIGLSFGGPPNAALQKAIERLSKQGIVLIAAAGNGGRKAKPVYPAAYDRVVAATAVDASGQVYARANRGPYIDVAAPGVALWTADGANAGKMRSGTSLAVPFVAAIVLEHMSRKQRSASLDPAQGLAIETIDLGAPGHDDIYGRGLVVHRGACGK
jgi:subtilisin family serine protease